MHGDESHRMPLCLLAYPRMSTASSVLLRDATLIHHSSVVSTYYTQEASRIVRETERIANTSGFGAVLNTGSSTTELV